MVVKVVRNHMKSIASGVSLVGHLPLVSHLGGCQIDLTEIVVDQPVPFAMYCSVHIKGCF